MRLLKLINKKRTLSSKLKSVDFWISLSTLFILIKMCFWERPFPMLPMLWIRLDFCLCKMPVLLRMRRNMRLNWLLMLPMEPLLSGILVSVWTEKIWSIILVLLLILELLSSSRLSKMPIILTWSVNSELVFTLIS